MEGEEQDRQCTYNVTLRRVSLLGKSSAFLTMANSTVSEAFPSGTRNFFTYLTNCSVFLTDFSYRSSIRNVVRHGWNAVVTATLYHTQQEKNRRSGEERGCVFIDSDSETAIILAMKPKSTKIFLQGIREWNLPERSHIVGKQ